MKILLDERDCNRVFEFLAFRSFDTCDYYADHFQENQEDHYRDADNNYA